MTGFRVASQLVVFEGQSLNTTPTSNPYPTQLMATYFPTVPYVNCAINGVSWTDLYTTRNGRALAHAKAAATTVLVMCGGTADVGRDGDSAAQVYADMEAYADAAIAAGFTYVIGSTITPAASITGGEETIRVAANALIVADAGNAFDGVADFAAHANLDDATDLTYYSDGTHWTEAGATVAAGVAYPVLDALI